MKICLESKMCQESKKTLKNSQKVPNPRNERFKALGRGLYVDLKKWHIFAFRGLENQKNGNFSGSGQKMPKNGLPREIWKKGHFLPVFERSQKKVKFCLVFLGLLTPFPSQLGAKKGPVNIENREKSGVIR